MEDSKVLIKNNKLSPLKLLLSLEKTKKKICYLINNDCLNYIISFLNIEPLYSVCRWHHSRYYIGDYLFTEKEACALLEYAYFTEVCGMGYHLRQRLAF